MNQSISAPRSQDQILASNKVLKNTYLLLSATLLFSAVMAAVSIFLQVSPMFYLGSVIGAMVLGMFVLPRTANSASGIGVIFLITGLLGFGLGAILQMYLALPKGPQIVGTALAGTGIIFLGLSGYALTTRKNFNFMGGFLFAGMIALAVAIIANLFLAMPALSMAISAAMILVMSGFILWDTSRIARGEETNYIMATYGIYLSIFNIFISLLNLLGIMGDE
jgi:modulator of FtsH protease